MHCFHAFEISRDVLFREAEICNFRCPISWIFWPFAHHDDVRRFDIPAQQRGERVPCKESVAESSPMTDSILMQKRHCIRELPHHVEASPFWDGPSFLNPHPQVTTFPSANVQKSRPADVLCKRLVIMVYLSCTIWTASVPLNVSKSLMHPGCLIRFMQSISSRIASMLKLVSDLFNVLIATKSPVTLCIPARTVANSPLPDENSREQ